MILLGARIGNHNQRYSHDNKNNIIMAVIKSAYEIQNGFSPSSLARRRAVVRENMISSQFAYFLTLAIMSISWPVAALWA